LSFLNEHFNAAAKTDRFQIGPELVGFISAHNQGTCRMGLTTADSVVNQRLQVHGLKNLYVMDASFMPTSASTHIMVPIMVMADRAVHLMLER
jgi:choline dehydrogenase-like flavoprotein